MSVYGLIPESVDLVSGPLGAFWKTPGVTWLLLRSGFPHTGLIGVVLFAPPEGSPLSTEPCCSSVRLIVLNLTEFTRISSKLFSF